MIKRKKHLIILTVLLLITSLVTIIVKNVKVEKEKIANIEKTVIDLDATSITNINWASSKDTFAFDKEEDTWYLNTDKDFPVDQESIEKIIDDVSKVDVSFVIENVNDYNQYGLDDPQLTVTFTTDDNKMYVIKFGDYSSMDKERYVDIDDGNVYLLTTDIMDEFEMEIDDFFAYEEIPNMSSFEEMIVSGETQLDIIYDDDNTYTYSKLFTYFLKNKNNKTLGNSEVETLANKISNLEFVDYACYTANNEDLSKYGLDNPRIDVKFNYVDDDGSQQTFLIHLSSDVIPVDEDDEVTYYARIDGSDNVYVIYESDFNAFKEASYDTLRQSEVLLLDFKDVSQIDIELDEENYTVISEVDDENIIYKMNDEEITFGDVVEDLQALQIVEYTNDIPDKTMQLAVTLHLNNEDFSTLSIKVYKYDSENSLLVFNDSYKALVSRQDIIDLIEDINVAVLN